MNLLLFSRLIIIKLNCWQTWLAGRDSDNWPGLAKEAAYWCKCAGDIDAGAYMKEKVYIVIYYKQCNRYSNL